MNTSDLVTIANRIYPSYNEALKLCDDVGYSMKALTEVVIKKNLIFKKSLKTDTFLGPEVTRTLMGIGFAMSSKSLRVIDFGGGGGYHYTLARHALGEACQIKWNVVETESMCESGSAIADRSLKFFSEITDAHKDLGYVDLILASSSLQYCPDPLQYLKSLLTISAKYIYITRTPFTTGSDALVSIQSSLLSHNGPGLLPEGYSDQMINYPISYIPLKQVEEIIQEKYTIKFRVNEEPASLFLNGNSINAYHGLFCELN